jgi:hypothetical protein
MTDPTTRTLSTSPSSVRPRTIASWCRGPGATVVAGAIILLGLSYRLALTQRLPVGYDEVFVMSVGLEEMADGADQLLIEVPVTRSSGITPLWWWIEYVPFWLTGGLSLAVLRVVPVLLGAATMAMAFFVARRTLGRRIALVFLGFLCLSDIVAFTNGRGDFSESLSLLAIVALACLMGRRGYALARGVLLFVLLMAGLGKGLCVLVLVLAAESTVTLIVPRERWQRVKGILTSLAVALVPTAAYLLWANSHFASAGVIRHDAVEASNVVDLIRKLTLDYAQVKAHVTGGVRDAAQVYLDFAVWPVTVVSVVPLIGGLVWGCRLVVACWFRPRSRRGRQVAGLVIWAVLGAAVVIGRGTAGARFHLLYLPALWMLAAMWLSGGRRRPWAWKLIFGWLTAGYVACAAGWTDWTQARIDWGTVAMVAAGLMPVVALVVYATTRKGLAGRVVWPVGILAAWVTCIVTAGPATWAHYARFEPMVGSEELAALDDYRSGRQTQPPAPHGRTLLIDLAHYHLFARPTTREHRERALHHARREVARDQSDARAWFYLGLALQNSGAPITEVRQTWERSLSLKPSEIVERHLAELDSR